MSKRVAVVLSGCGVYDGAEVYEAVLTLLHLSQAGAQVQCFAPDMPQLHVVNHLTGEVAAGETRNVLVEAARVVRGQIKPVTEARVEDFDALIVPGGFGAAKNLSDFAINGAAMTVQKDFLAFAQAMHAAKKPIGLICIAPTMAAAICGAGTKTTIGNDADTAAAVNATGAQHCPCVVQDTCIDREKKLVTTPAYMLAHSIAEANTGIGKLVAEVLALI
ncbi:MAG: isoprenoid biosynthesis glyoxalase ElbB [Cellvibrionales bacterium]|jgi:enhancing lycopene biosynthesis protein 2|nr:isoprenoid biosynthesis glyoxalase ElbB [Cellvibrionales bacterium]MBK8674927.1 isoprenoid biosynthesis glyoxalase ElbB [Cellvibrionales bacterium]TXH52269.1 MAG: isoprenoid biosynthesis glyoxalase ElbB [Cellvibrionales bacterium]HRF87311.1 isoprenoid biosynthesis glyoxalase ElbB [Pseudomonadales bacterium]HRG49431.1 isoprenoid biosynthesis glyoxalase ElbB [Pseudomonadales bacterium]